MTQLRRMPAIDGLRAIAVAAVFAYHAAGGSVPGGFLGVDLFFVISGYLITSLLLAEFGEAGRIDLVAFWCRRARRLLPALFLLLGACLLVAATVERGKLPIGRDALAAIAYVANWRFIFAHQSYFDTIGRPPLLRHLWTLAVEEQFYLLWPPLLVLGLRLRHRLVLPALVAVATAASTALMWVVAAADGPSRAYYGTDTHAAPILLGVLLAFVWKPDRMPSLRFPFARPALDLLSLTALAAVAAAFAGAHDAARSMYHGGFLLFGVGAAVLLATVVHPLSLLGRVLAVPPLRWIGDRSYGIYLWHWPVLALSRPGVDVQLPRAAVVTLQVAVTLALAEASYRLVERPIRGGGLRALAERVPRVRLRRALPVAATTTAAAALAGIAAVTPAHVRSLPPGFTAAALAASDRAQTHLLPLPRSTHAAAPGRRRTGAGEPAWLPRRGPILAVGDSVLLGAGGALEHVLGPEVRIDATVSRQPKETIDRLFAYRAEHALPRRVVVHIGDNGPVYYEDWQRLKRALAGVPLVVLVNVRVDQGWQNEVNREMRRAVSGWRHATIADWYGVSGDAAALVDGIHTSVRGGALLAAAIRRALERPHLGGVTR